MSIAIEKKGPVTTVILERTEVRNAVDQATALELAEAFREFAEDKTALVGVLYGVGGHFCAGADLKAIAQNKSNRIDAEGDGPMGPTRMLLEKPVIAAISGYAVAGGLELALWCDIRIAEEGAVLGFFNRRWGIPLIDGGTVRLPRIIGLGRALDLILTGRPVAAKEALEMGLINRLTPPGKAREYAEKMAYELAQFPQLCLNNDRLSAYEQFGHSYSIAMANEFQRGLLSLPEAIEGANRFTQGSGRHGSFT